MNGIMMALFDSSSGLKDGLAGSTSVEQIVPGNNNEEFQGELQTVEELIALNLLINSKPLENLKTSPVEPAAVNISDLIEKNEVGSNNRSNIMNGQEKLLNQLMANNLNGLLAMEASAAVSKTDGLRDIPSNIIDLSGINAGKLSEHLIEQISGRTGISSRSGFGSEVMPLEPPALGRLKMTIVVKDNMVQAIIAADNPVVKEVLGSRLDGLKDTLMQQGLKVDELIIQQGQQGQQWQQGGKMGAGYAGYYSLASFDTPVDVLSSGRVEDVPAAIRDSGNVASGRFSEHLIEQVRGRIGIFLRSGFGGATIRLDPPELGRLKMTIVINDNVVRAIIAADHPMVKEVLEANLNGLKDALTQQGLKVDELTVFLEDGSTETWHRNWLDSFWEKQDGLDSSLETDKSQKGELWLPPKLMNGDRVLDIYV